MTVIGHLNINKTFSLAVSTLDSPAVEPRSNPGSGKILMSENLRLYTIYTVLFSVSLKCDVISILSRLYITTKINAY